MQKYRLAACLALFTSSLFSLQLCAKLFKKLPKQNLFTIKNDTDHQLVIINGKNYYKMAPDGIVTLYWKKSYATKNPLDLDIYYGGNIANKAPSLALDKKNRISKKFQSKSMPVRIARIKPNQPGMIRLFYSHDGILQMKRSA